MPISFLASVRATADLGAPVYNDTFTGYQAGYNNTGNELEPILGSGNSFYGVQAGYSNSYGWDDTFVGLGAGYGNTNGYMNTYVGSRAGLNNTNGFYNTFLGWHAGSNSTTGTSDIYIGNSGPSTGTEGYTIRIGFPYTEEDEDCLPCPDCEILPCGQNTTYIAGIYGSTVGGSGIAVYVDNNGQLGTVVSSLRFKEQVRDMGDSTNALMKLRPVTFFYKPEYDKGPRMLQYGLIAEEVAKVYPELVAYDKEGKPYTVRYQYITTMLLNEVQKQYQRAEKQSETIETQQQQIKAQQQEIESLKQQLQVQNATLQERLSRLEGLVRTEMSAK